MVVVRRGRHRCRPAIRALTFLPRSGGLVGVGRCWASRFARSPEGLPGDCPWPALARGGRPDAGRLHAGAPPAHLGELAGVTVQASQRYRYVRCDPAEGIVWREHRLSCGPLAADPSAPAPARVLPTGRSGPLPGVPAWHERGVGAVGPPTTPGSPTASNSRWPGRAWPPPAPRWWTDATWAVTPPSVHAQPHSCC